MAFRPEIVYRYYYGQETVLGNNISKYFCNLCDNIVDLFKLVSIVYDILVTLQRNLYSETCTSHSV